ncbi:hypothetical protein BUH_4337 [Burkholderia pseudomallei Pakistan 9]|nr:hypothetical protein BUH_4337 [Burkholderia pseudomallei Pakistan 9]
MGQSRERLHIDVQGGREASWRNDRRSALRIPQGRHEPVEIEGRRRIAGQIRIHGGLLGAHYLHIYSTSSIDGADR